MSLRGVVSLFFNLIGLAEGPTKKDNPLPSYMIPSTIISESASSLSNFMENVEGGQCCVCLSKLSNKDEIRVLPCSHEFHKICVNKWLKGHHKTCPLCRFSIGAKEKSHHRAEMFTEEMLIWFSSFHIAGM
ncbi:putative transcription factor C2H2 family [Lupinus albus]|uniref:RING-type E3 ubiquitin transferase n=1 Tax=Lupinus albus TaxID=3870 RepID=A0A6A4PZ40_LUPAL|nr:putative transcription factor C2H2 family [Lupinus albus]